MLRGFIVFVRAIACLLELLLVFLFLVLLMSFFIVIPELLPSF
jgi:hypothetical protein